MDKQTSDLREVFLVLKRRLLLILTVPMIATIGAALITQYLLTPVYKASTTLWVIKADPAQISYNDLLLSRNLTRTYAEVARSRAVVVQAMADVGLQGVPAEALQKRLFVTPVKETEILSFTIHDQDPAMAAKLANAVATAFQRQIRSQMQVENVVIVDPAVEPLLPFKPRLVINLAAAFFMGLMTAVGFSFMAEFLDTRIRNAEDVTRYLGLPVLAVVPAFQVITIPKPKSRSARQPSREQPMTEGEGV